MKKYVFLSYLGLVSIFSWAQGTGMQTSQQELIGKLSSLQNPSLQIETLQGADKGKPIKYNAFGMGLIPTDYLMVGGNHVSFRKFGAGLSWRLGVNNMQINKEGFSEINIDTAKNNGWLTGKSKLTYSYGANLNFVFAITKKIPGYFGIGAIRQRGFLELQTPFANPGETEWQLDPDKTKFVFNFGAGVFIPLASRVVLNLSYDHMPQTVFVGIAISGPFNYEDIDMW